MKYRLNNTLCKIKCSYQHKESVESAFTDIMTNMYKDVPSKKKQEAISLEKILTIKQVAEKIGVCKRTILRYIRDKKLRASKIGQWRILEKDLDELFNKNANEKK